MASRPNSAASTSAARRPTAVASADVARTGVPAAPNTATAHRATVSSGASSTAATAPAMAKSPWRRANSATPQPVRPVHTGNAIDVSNSSASSAVDQTPVKNSLAGTVRDPVVDASSNVASSATATAGYSAAGSAWASEPPIVPRLRIWKWPM